MKKLRLEDIQVDSYATHPAPQARGTVRANGPTALCQTFQCPSDYASCVSAPWCC